MANVSWKPELWKPVIIPPVDGKGREVSSPVKSFFDYQDPAETYEVRGILPRSNVTFRDQD